MQKYSFVMKDGNKFQMETSVNDSLMVVCNDDFYVCPHCGYAESTSENMKEAGFNSHQKTMEKTGASSATISRVKRCLDYGEGGYALVLDRLSQEEQE